MTLGFCLGLFAVINTEEESYLGEQTVIIQDRCDQPAIAWRRSSRCTE